MSARLIAVVLALGLSGCSAVSSVSNTVGGWFGSGPSKPKPAELVEFKPAATLTEAWKAETGDAGGYLLQPQAEGDDAFAAGGGRVVRVAVPTGQVAWRSDTGVKLSAGAGVAGDLVLAGGSKGELLALDRAGGQSRWKVNLSSEVVGQLLRAGFERADSRRGIGAKIVAVGQFGLTGGDEFFDRITVHLKPPKQPAQGSRAESGREDQLQKGGVAVHRLSLSPHDFSLTTP